MEKCKSNCRGRASKTTGKMGKGISEKSNLQNYWQNVLGKFSPNSCRGRTTTVDEGPEDTYLISKSQESELKEARCKPNVKKDNLALSKKEKKKEGQSSLPLRIKGEMTLNSAYTAHTLV